MNANPIEVLVRQSVAQTTLARTAEGAHPHEVIATITKLASEVGSNLRSMKEFSETQKRLQVLSQFPLLNNEALKEMHRVTVKHDDVFASADIPLYGIAGVDVVRSWIRVQYTTLCEGRPRQVYGLKGEAIWKIGSEELNDSSLPHECDAVSWKDWGLHFLVAANELVVSFDERNACMFFLNVPKLPQRVKDQAKEASGFGFTNLSVVWGPTTLTLQVSTLPVDPLLIGKMFGQWWILDQWDPTDTEKWLVNSP